MSIVTKASLKNDFLTDQVITQDKMEDLIDSCYNGTGEVYQYDRTFTADELINMNYIGAPFNGIEVLPAPGPGKCYVKANSTIIGVYKYRGDVFTLAPNASLRLYWPELGPGPALTDTFSNITLDASGGFAERLRLDISTENTAIHADWSLQGQDQSVSAPGFINQPWYIGTNAAVGKNSPLTDGTVHIRFWYSIVDISDIWF